jgi:hypothetical protein
MKKAETAVLALSAAAGAGCVIGRYRGVSEAGLLLVEFDGNPHAPAPCEAQTVCTEFAAGGPAVATGRQVLLQFDRGDPARPVVIGLLQPPLAQARIDGSQAMTLRADRRLELVCGKASIVLTADGKVVVKGAHLVSRSSGPNKIRGATVDIN